MKFNAVITDKEIEASLGKVVDKKFRKIINRIVDERINELLME